MGMQGERHGQDEAQRIAASDGGAVLASVKGSLALLGGHAALDRALRSAAGVLAGDGRWMPPAGAQRLRMMRRQKGCGGAKRSFPRAISQGWERGNGFNADNSSFGTAEEASASRAPLGERAMPGGEK